MPSSAQQLDENEDREFDRSMMLRAVRLALRGVGYVAPNPPVGCVIVDQDRRIIATGYHARFGGPHAECSAIESCPDPSALRGATAYVTLEPCGHHGKTPPCAEALSACGIVRCVIGRLDPNPQSGEGIEQLRRAGLRVEVMDCPEAQRLVEPFVKRLTTGMPWICVKWAQTVDGCIAAASGDSRWISNPRSRAAVHRMRGRVDVILTGIGTVLRDDPLLTARLGGRTVRRVARRVVIDPQLAISPNSRLVQTARSVPTTVITTAGTHAARPDDIRQLESAGVEIICMPDEAVKPQSLDQISLSHVLGELVERHETTTVLVEAGRGLVSDLLRAGLVDELLIYVAPNLLGDARAMHPVRGFDVQTVGDSLQLRLRRVRQLGQDVELLYRLS